MKGSLSHTVEVGADPIGNITRLNNALEGLGDNLAKVEENLANTQTQLENAKAEVTKPFPREQELTEKLERLVELNALLNVDETAELLASAIDQFMYDYDTYEYYDTVENQEEAIMQLAKDIVNGTAEHVQDYLIDIYMQNNTYSNEAMQLLHRLEAIGAVQPEDNLAFQIADRYITIYCCDDGYDYNICDENYKLLDGGVYDNPDYSIREVLRDVVDDLKSDLTSGIRGNVKQDDDLVKIDNDELSILIEEAEQAQMSQLKERAEYNHLSEADIKENILAYVQTQFDELNEYNHDFGLKIVYAAIYGSRSRGVHTEQSDIDIVVEYTGNMKESSLFNVLYEDWSIGGMKVDINPIRAEESGVLSDFLVRADKTLDEKIQGKQSAEKLIYYVAECAEFPNYGEYHDKLTLDEAVYQYQQIPSDRLNGVKGIGFELQTANDTMTFDLYSGGRIDVDTINMIPEFKNSPVVQKAIEDIRERFPNATVIDFEQKKAQEYKPLAKVEELQECNYNMVDNVLNNGANRKPEEEKKVRARISLKEKLAEKKEVVKRQRVNVKRDGIDGRENL